MSGRGRSCDELAVYEVPVTGLGMKLRNVGLKPTQLSRRCL